MEERPSNTTCLPWERPSAGATVSFERVFPNLLSQRSVSNLTLLIQPPQDPTEFWFATRDGLIGRLDNDPNVIDWFEVLDRAHGLRNPYRGDLDQVTQQLWIGDVGYTNLEEVSLIARGGNLGWDTVEGTSCRDGGPHHNGNGIGDLCKDPTLIPPVVKYSHGNGNYAVIGGYVYRGMAIPEMQGKFLFADFCTSKVSMADYDENGDTLPELLDQSRQVDYVVASRLHGILLSHRFCLPVLAISYDRKVDTYMADLGLEQYRVDIHDARIDSLVDVFEALTEDFQSIRSTLEEINDRFARDLQHQYDAVLGQE